MKWIAIISLLAQACGATTALLMSIWLKMPPAGVAGIALATIGLGLAQIRHVARSDRLRVLPAEAVAWLGSAIVAVILVRNWSRLAVPDYLYVSALAWTVAATLFLAGFGIFDRANRNSWVALGMAWAFGGAFTWLAGAYYWNATAPFFAGILIVLGLLLASRKCFKLPLPAILTANTLILLFVGLPIADWMTRSNRVPGIAPDEARRFYSYEAASHDPDAFKRWWNYYLSQWLALQGNVIVPDTNGIYPFRLRPGGHGVFFESAISINKEGFRGPEIPQEKGDAYRIVMLGESTTFDFTMGAQEKPWPELLGRLIREQIQTRRPVEVINAGVPGYTIQHSVMRLQSDILPLKPDMIISYHGANGFRLLHSVLGVSSVELPPPYRPRPLKLLAQCEYQMKMLWYRKHRKLPRKPLPSLAAAMGTDYAEAYRGLIKAARTNGISLVLATYSMAVNDRSNRDVIEFYRAGFPMVDWWIKANELHAGIVQELAKENPEICFVDTRPNLDGEHEKFVDVMHFNEDGREQLATAVFDGIKDFLQKDLSGRAATNHSDGP